MKSFRLSSILHLPCAFLVSRLLVADDPAALERERMVSEQIESRGIRDPAVLRAMRATPRHLFVPTFLRATAYEDEALPIGHGATISQPYVVALMTELLKPAKSQRVLEIGTGSGYQAAVLAQIVAQVYTIEIVPELAQSAARTLQALRYTNVMVRQGDGYQGWPEQAPFDGIILTAAPPEIPPLLIQQLANGGRLVAPVGPLAVQELVLIEKKTDGTIQRRPMGLVRFIPMKPGPR